MIAGEDSAPVPCRTMLQASSLDFQGFLLARGGSTRHERDMKRVEKRTGRRGDGPVNASYALHPGQVDSTIALPLQA